MTNPANGKIVFVKVTDRGPYGRGRIIDLSWRAAKELGMLDQGVAMVLVEPVDTTIIPFKPNEAIEDPEFGFGSVIAEDIRPEWYEMKEINHKQAKGHPKKKVAARHKAQAATHSKPHAQTDNARQKTHQSGNSGGDKAIEEINSKPNTSRSFSKRQQGK